MSVNDELSEKEDKIILEALKSSQVETPDLLSMRIKKAARDSLEEKKAKELSKPPAKAVWMKLFPLAACIVLSFYAGRTFQDSASPSADDNLLVFQGNKPTNVSDEAAKWTEDKLLKAIAEAALAGDINKAEQLIELYKKNYPKDNQ